MKKKLLSPMITLILVLVMVVGMAGTVMAWWEASSKVMIQGPASPVPAGSTVSLNITETNDGHPVYWFSEPWVSLEPGGYVLNKSSDYYAGGDTGDDGIMEAGETWESC